MADFHSAGATATGAGARSRIKWHVAQLCGLTAAVKHPLHLIVRGGFGELAALYKAFAGLTAIETNAFMKSQKRRRAILREGKLAWERSGTFWLSCAFIREGDAPSIVSA